MIKYHFVSAWRQLKKQKFYSVLNVLGLAIGLATGIMLLMWVQKEQSYDSFNKQADQIYRVNYAFENADKGKTYGSSTPAPLKPFSADITAIADVVRVLQRYDINDIKTGVKKMKNLHYSTFYVDDGFFNMLSMPLLYGNGQKPFNGINSIVLSASVARALYGKEDVVGKTLYLSDTDSYAITGVIQDMPENTSVAHADILLPMAKRAAEFTGNGKWKTIDEDMGNYFYTTYVKLHPGADAKNVGAALTDLWTARSDSHRAMVQFSLQPLLSLHLTAADGNQASRQMVLIIMWVAILILVIACINYINLTTARSLVRTKEVTIRKINGAGRKQLFFQFITETLTVFMLAFVLAIGLIYALMPLYNYIAGQRFSIHLTDPAFWKIIGLITLGTLAVTGIYPAILMSSVRPALSLKGVLHAKFGTSLLRKVLVVVQFSISVVIIIATIVMGKQMRYIRNMDPGYNKSYVFTVFMPDGMFNHYDAVRSELLNDKSILSIGTAAFNITDVGASSGDIIVPGKENLNQIFFETDIDKDLISTLQLKFNAGHNFSGMPSDSSAYIINEVAAAAIGMTGDAVGKTVTYHGREGTIIGVLKDFNFKNLKESIQPLIISSGAWGYQRRLLYVRTNAAMAADAISRVEHIYKHYGSEDPFSFEFLDKSFEAQYKTEQRTGSLFSTFALIAVFLSCLGLFGLSTYTCQLRLKEIGVRKVLGASKMSVVYLIGKDFLKLIAVSILVAAPLAYQGAKKWLENFVYRTDVGITTLVTAAAAVVLIAVLTISIKAFQAASANPVKVLKTGD